MHPLLVNKARENLKDIEITALGNRATLLGYSLGGTCLTSSMAITEAGVIDSMLGVFYGLAIVCSGIGGAMLLGQTLFGQGTREIYWRTRDHIEKHGELDSRYILAVIDDCKLRWNSPTLGYCQMQGVYLAARDKGQLERFREVVNEHSHIRVPHF